MTKRCQVTGRRTKTGNSYAIRGIAKKKKGIGLNTTGITRRRFKVNLVKKRFWLPEERRWITLRLSTAAIREIDKKGVSQVVREMRVKGERI